MTDENTEVQAPQESEQPQQTEPRQPTLEEIKVIKAEILKMCQKNYHNFIDTLRELPIHQAAFHQCFLYFDTGALWMKEAIEFAPLVQKQTAPVEPVAPPAETVE